MAGLERYPNYPQNQQRLWDRRFQEKYSEEEMLRPSQLPLQPSVTVDDPNTEDDDDAVKKYVGIGVGLASLITENLLSHPFVVLKRQCQVHNTSNRYHIVPVTLIPVIIRMHQRQGITTLWKGLGSVLMIRGMSLAVEDFISKVTPWPKEISWHSSLKSFGQHILLKCTTFAIITPFYSASLVETVQSDIASEKPGIFDVFKEGICRLVSWGAPQKGRMLPVWALVVPTVVFGLLKYLVSLATRGVTSKVLQASYKKEQQRQGALSKDTLSQPIIEDIKITSTLTGMITADILFFPLETILHRLHLQGTRTIIDNLDTGYQVIPILTSYEGVGDCFRTILQQEGSVGFYKGFGAIVLQFAAHIAVIKLTKLILTHISTVFRSSAKPVVVGGVPPQPDLTQMVSPRVPTTTNSFPPPPAYNLSQQTYLPYE